MFDGDRKENIDVSGHLSLFYQGTVQITGDIVKAGHVTFCKLILGRSSHSVPLELGLNEMYLLVFTL